MPAFPQIEALAARAREGNRDALEQLVGDIQRPIYALALRMLWHPEDAADATQDILVRIITNLGSFRGESSFQTWMFRIAANHLSSVRRSRVERQELTFSEFGRDLDHGMSEAVDESLLLEELRVGCTLAMLQCLDRPHRLAYILGDIMELDHTEGAAALEVSPAAFRKRLSRARAAVVSFLRAKCGLFERANPCRCGKRVHVAVEKGRLDPNNFLFASNAERAGDFPVLLAQIRSLEETRRAVALYRAQEETAPPEGLSQLVRDLLGPY